MIELTCGLPLKDMGDIAWLQLHSLMRQRGIDFEWELIIYDDDGDNRVQDINDYKRWLKKAGCVRVVYEKCDPNLSLGEKWGMMGKDADIDSKVFLLCGGDDYSPAWRLSEAYDLHTGYGADITQYTNSLMYDINTRKMVRFDARNAFTKERLPMTGHHISLRTEYMRKLPATIKKTEGVDTWVQTLARMLDPKLNLVNNLSESAFTGFCTTGRNKITGGRAELIKNVEAPYFPVELELRDVVSPDIADRLEALSCACL